MPNENHEKANCCQRKPMPAAPSSAHAGCAAQSEAPASSDLLSDSELAIIIALKRATLGALLRVYPSSVLVQEIIENALEANHGCTERLVLIAVVQLKSAELVTQLNEKVSSAPPVWKDWLKLTARGTEAAERRFLDETQNQYPGQHSPEARDWKPPPGFVGTKTIRHDSRFWKNGKKLPRSTLQGWVQKATNAGNPPKTERDPASGECYYELAWIFEQIELWSPQA